MKKLLIIIILITSFAGSSFAEPFDRNNDDHLIDAECVAAVMLLKKYDSKDKRKSYRFYEKELRAKYDDNIKFFKVEIKEDYERMNHIRITMGGKIWVEMAGPTLSFLCSSRI